MKSKVANILCWGALAVGLMLLGAKLFTAWQYSVTPAKIVGIDPSSAECRRRTGKIENCQHFDVTVEYQRKDSGTITGVVGAESPKMVPKIGDEINVFVNKKNPADVTLNVYREGWKLPLILITFSSFALFLLAKARVRE